MRTCFSVGVAGPLSGPLQEYGQLLIRAAQANSHPAIKWIIRDDKADSLTAESIAKEFVSLGVSLVVGHFNSACAMTAAKIYGAEGIPFVAPLTTLNDLIECGCGWVLRPCGSNSQQAEIVAEFLRSHNISWSQVEFFCDQTLYGLDLLKSFLHLRDKASRSPDSGHTRVYILAAKKHWAEREFFKNKLFNQSAIVIFTDDSFMPSLCRLKTKTCLAELKCIGSEASVDFSLNRVFSFISASLVEPVCSSREIIFQSLEKRLEQTKGERKWLLFDITAQGFQ